LKKAEIEVSYHRNDETKTFKGQHVSENTEIKDYGSGLFVKNGDGFAIIGVLSQSGNPLTFVNVFEYVDWINEVIQPN